MVAYRGKTNGATIRQSATIRCSGTIATIARPIVTILPLLYRIRSFGVHDIDSGSLDLHSHALLRAGKAVYCCTPRG